MALSALHPNEVGYQDAFEYDESFWFVSGSGTVNTKVFGRSLSYDATVLADSPSYFWELNESSGTTAADAADSNAGIYQGTVTHGAVGIGDGETATLLNGSSGWVSTATQITSPSPPFSIEVWFKVANGYASGGGLFQFNSTQTTTVGSSGISNDRQLWMDNSGHLNFGVFTSTTVQITTTAAYNDGNWHYVVARVAANNNMSVYVDGSLVASNASTGTPVSYSGWWRVGHLGDLVTWANLPTSGFLAGTLAKAAIYPVALTTAQITAHFTQGTLVPGPSLGFVGTASRTIARNAVTATLTNVGSLGRATIRSLTANASFLGQLFRARFVLLTAVLTSAGVTIRRTGRAASAAINFAGSVPHVVAALVTGSLSFTGTALRRTTHGLAATLGFIGSTVASRLRLVALSGSVAFAGAVNRLTTAVVNASVAFVGAIRRTTSHGLIAVTSFAGTIGRNSVRVLAGNLTSTGLIARISNRIFVATLGFSGQARHQVTRLLSAALSFAGKVVKTPVRAVSGVLAFSGAQTRATNAVLNGVLSFTGSIKRSVAHILAAVLSFTGNLLTIGNNMVLFTANLVFSGVTNKRVTRTLTAISSFAGLVGRQLPHTMTGVLSLGGSVFKRTGYRLNATSTFAGVMARQTRRGLAGVVSSAGSIGRLVRRTLTAIVSPVGAMHFPRTQVFQAALFFTGQTAQKSARLLQSALSTVGSTSQSTLKALQGALTFVGTRTILRIVTFVATLSFSDTLQRGFQRSLEAILGLGGIIASGRGGIVTGWRLMGTFLRSLIPSTIVNPVTEPFIIQGLSGDNLNHLFNPVLMVTDPRTITATLPNWQNQLYEQTNGNFMLTVPIDTAPRDRTHSK